MINMSSSMMYHIDNLNVQNEKISYQMATGTAIDKGSDDSMLHSRLINLDDKLRVSEGLSLQITKTQAVNDTADDAIGEVKTSLESIKLDLMKALNDGMDRTDKLALATNLEGIRENLIDRMNSSIDGEYIFAGSVSSKETLVLDSEYELNGKVEYEGDGFLRKIAVEPGSYRDRGVTAYDVSFYTNSKAYATEQLTFQDGERIIDEGGYEWKVIDDLGGIYDSNDPARTATAIQQYDHNGIIRDSATYPDSIIAISSTTAAVEASDTAQATQMTFTTVALNSSPEGRVLEAKHNYFDDLNVIINALEGHSTMLDGTRGSIISDSLVDDSIQNGLEQTSQQYDASNIGHGELGGRNAVFNVAQERIESQVTNYNILIQEYGGADLAKLAMESKALELTYQSLYSTIAKMNNLSIIDYLK
ncbi:MAG: hypothetical protein U9O56_04410 [Campylobacterota bacterium]|nr:hypothetical protein [Campylobacterota bacterium]